MEGVFVDLVLEAVVKVAPDPPTDANGAPKRWRKLYRTGLKAAPEQ